MSPGDYVGLTQQGVLGLGVLFFGSACVYLVVRLFNVYEKFGETLLKLNMEQITAQNANTIANNGLIKAIEGNNETLKDLQRK